MFPSLRDSSPSPSRWLANKAGYEYEKCAEHLCHTAYHALIGRVKSPHVEKILRTKKKVTQLTLTDVRYPW